MDNIVRNRQICELFAHDIYGSEHVEEVVRSLYVFCVDEQYGILLPRGDFFLTLGVLLQFCVFPRGD